MSYVLNDFSTKREKEKVHMDFFKKIKFQVQYLLLHFKLVIYYQIFLKDYINIYVRFNPLKLLIIKFKIKKRIIKNNKIMSKDKEKVH